MSIKKAMESDRMEQKILLAIERIAKSERGDKSIIIIRHSTPPHIVIEKHRCNGLVTIMVNLPRVMVVVKTYAVPGMCNNAYEFPLQDPKVMDSIGVLLRQISSNLATDGRR